MAYMLDDQESLNVGTVRILREEFEAALDELERDGEQADEGVHECRKHLKKARAALRLISDAIPADLHARERIALRDAARLLAPLREQTALVECVDALPQPLDDPALGEGLVLLRSRAAALCEAHRSDVADGLNARGQAKDAVSAQVARIGEWADARMPWKCAQRGLHRSYLRARRAMKEAQADPNVETLHAWRKNVKDLRYQTSLLSPIWPRYMQAMEDELHDLTDRLGEAHDLALLEDMLRNDHEMPMNVELRAKAGAHMARQFLEKQRAAFELGPRLFAESAQAFERRMRAYFKAWRQGAPDADAAKAR